MQPTIAKEMDSVQFKMLASLLRVARLPTEEPRDYFRRRNRHASDLLRTNGRWSLMWAKRLKDWHAHLLRVGNSRTWGAILLPFRSAEFLRAQRLANHSLPSGGRTRTRAAPGPVQKRWEESLELARNMTN